MGRCLAIDYGLKRVGLAVTDPERIIATPLDTIPEPEVLDYLQRYVDKETVDVFVVGLPRKLDGSDTDITKDVHRFVGKLKEKFPQKDVILQDERFTSSIALDAMIAGGMKKKQRQKKENIDRISATLILQSFLEKTNR